MKIYYYNKQCAGNKITEKTGMTGGMIPADDMDFGACIVNKDDMWAGKSGSPEQICAQSVASMECKSFADAWTEAMVADSLAQRYNHLWLAEDQAGNACGYLLANILGDETELLRIAVNPECRKDGIGQMLMDAYFAYAQTVAARGLLEVRHGNNAAKHLYEKNGYHLLAVRKNYYKHPDEDADIYEIVFTENGE